MKRFSVKAFAFATLLHVVGTICLVSAAASRIKAYEHGESFLWLTVLSWIWMPVPVSLGHTLSFGPARFLYYLAFPWSLCVGACFGFLLPHLSRWRHRNA